MRNAGLDELQSGIKIGERNINNLTYADDTTLMAESKEELMSLMMRVEESERTSLRLNTKKLRSWHWATLFMENRRGNCGNRDRFPLLGLQNHCGWWLQPWNQRTISFWQDSDHKLRQCVEKQRHYFANKDHIAKAVVFPGVTYSCESWAIEKEECQRIDAFKLWEEKTPESPLDSKEIKLVSLKGDQQWIFTLKDWSWFWSSDANRQLIGKATDAGRDQAQKEKWASEDEMAGWHH